MLKSDSYHLESFENLKYDKFHETPSSLSPSETNSSKGFTDKTRSDKNLDYINTRTIGKWNKEEDDNLIIAVNKLGTKNWKKVSSLVQGRTPIQCLHRWTKILQPGLIKGPWTIDEDRKLMEWVNKEGATKWSQCADYIIGRSGKQCRERWFNTLNPNVKKGHWTPEEDYNIFQLYNKLGSQWSKIASYFKGRTENSIKNRFYSTLRRIATEKKKGKTKYENNSESSSSGKLNELLVFLPHALSETNIKYLNNSKELPKGISVNDSNGNFNQAKLYQESISNMIKNNNENKQDIKSNTLINNDKYEEYQKMPLSALENGIEELCNNKNNNLFFDKNFSSLDNKINEFIDNFFDNNLQKNNSREKHCYGCNNPEQFASNKDSSAVLYSLVQQLNDLEKMLQSTKNDLLMKKRIAVRNEEFSQFIRNEVNFNNYSNNYNNYGNFQMNLFSNDNFENEFNLN